MLIRKTAKPCINSMWIALLIHGFVLIKTWLLIVCDTAFYTIIQGSNMIFYALTSAGPRGRCWNPSPKGAQQMLMYQKSMFDRYYCIKAFVFARKPEFASKSLFTCTYYGTEKNVTCKRFGNPAFRAKTNVIATVHWWWRQFLCQPWNALFVKPQSRALTACELPC